MYRGVLLLGMLLGGSTGSDILDDDFNLDEFLKMEFDDLPGGISGSAFSEQNALRDFKEFDANNDEQIDALEIGIFQGTLSAADKFDFFATTDKDASGTISKSEYLAYARNLHSAR